jgi:hypothetical protein
VKTGRHRLGDGGDLVILQLVGREDGPTIGGGTSRRREMANNRNAFAAKLRKGDDAPAKEAATATAVAEPEAPVEEAAAPEAPTAEAPETTEEKKDE